MAIFSDKVTTAFELPDQRVLMLSHARELGANAVIGVRYDATEIGPGISEVLAYGTAVTVDTAP